MKMSEADYDAVLDTNLKGAFNTIRHMSRYFLEAHQVLGDAGLGLAGVGLHAAHVAAAALQQPADDPQPERVGQGLQQLRLLLIEGGGIAHIAHLIVSF